MISLPSHFLVTHHTQFVGSQSTFFAFVGNEHDGTKFIVTALTQGASKIVVQDGTLLAPHILEKIEQCRAELIFSSELRKDFAYACAQAYNFPADKLTIIGITGTKGKTTTTLLCAHLLRASGLRVAHLSSVYNAIMDTHLSTTLTTQHADYLHAFFATCVENQITHVVMEVAAQALSLHRTLGIVFSSIIFTNFSHEHGEFYVTQEDYFNAKCKIFDQLKKDGTLILNDDDPKTPSITSILKNNESVITFGKNEKCTFRWEAQASDFKWLHGLMHHKNNCLSFKSSTLCGQYNIANVCAAYAATTDYMKFHAVEFAQAVETFKGVAGRCERFTTKSGIHICIDHAHTPSSFESILSTLRPLTHNLIAVFGCGGERDREKRPMMTQIADTYAHTIYITSDNPRSEFFKNIASDMLHGNDITDKLILIDDRQEAISHALSHASSGSIIALLGKGCEEYQIIGSEKIPFSERSIIAAYL